jgi:hypothetical protein
LAPVQIDTRRIRPAELLALASGALLLGALFAPWYRFSSGNLSAWSTFTVIEVPLALAAISALALFGLTLTRGSPALPVALAVWTTLFGLIATLCVAFRLLDHPRGTYGLCFGAWLGFVACLGVLAAGWLAMRDERPQRGVPATVPGAR